MNPTDLAQKLEDANPDRIEFAQHFYQRARRRNIDTESVKEKLENREFVNVRENNQGDPNFDHSYRISVETEDGCFEMPIYFNVPGPKLLVKSIWPR